MPPRFLCRSTVWVVTVSLLFTCYEAAPPRVDTKYPAISKMTANSHPMLASVFNAANTASLQLVQTPSKDIGVKKIKDLPDIGGAGVKPEFIGIGASLFCRLCQLEKDLKCIERHCWNDGSSTGLQSSAAGLILVETTHNQHGNVAESSAVNKLPDQLKGGGQINVPDTGTVNFGVALPPALFASVAEPPAPTASLVIPSKVSSQVIVSQEKKQYTSGMPTLFSDFMSMDKYKGKKAAEYVPAALSESVVDKLTGVTTKVENLKEVRPGVVAPVDKSPDYVPSNIGNLEQMLNQLMGSRPLLPTAGTGSVDSPPGRTFDASSHVGNTPVDHKVIDVQATDIAPSFPRTSGEVLGRAQGNMVQGSTIDFGGMQEPAASMTLHPFDSSLTGIQSTHQVERVPSALSTGELLGPVPSHTDRSLAIVAASGQQSVPRALLLDNTVQGSNIALERLQQSSHIPTATDTQFQMFDSRTDVQGNPNAHPVVSNSADMHSTGMLLGPVQSHMEQSQSMAAGTRQHPENMPTTFNEPTMVGQSTHNIQPERPELSSSADILQGLAENLGQMLGQAHDQMAQGSHSALEPVQQVELAPLSHFQLDTPVMGGQGTRNIQPIVSMGEPQIFLHNNQNVNRVGNVGEPEVVAQNTGNAQQVNTEIHPQMSGQSTGNVRQVASAGKPELFVREQQGAAAGVSEFETTTFPTFEVETMSPQRKAQLREVSKLFLPAMAFNQK